MLQAMPEPLLLRDQPLPTTLIVVRLGTRTLDDVRLVAAAQRCHLRWGLWGFSVLEVPSGDDYDQLARLRPEVRERRQLLVARGDDLTGDGFALLATFDYPHWTVVLSSLDPRLLERVRGHFGGPIDNPAYGR